MMKNNISDDNSERVSGFGRGSYVYLWAEGLIPSMGSSISGFGIQPDSWPVRIECFLRCGNWNYLSIGRDAEIMEFCWQMLHAD
jgi:hypothetical protein